MSDRSRSDSQLLITGSEDWSGRLLPTPPGKDVDLEELTRQIVEWHREINLLMTASVIKAIHVGTLVLEVKKRLRHGSFQDWVASHLTEPYGISIRTMQRYINLAQKRKRLLHSIRTALAESSDAPPSEAQAVAFLSKMKIEDALALLRDTADVPNIPHERSNKPAVNPRRLPEAVLQAVLEFFDNGIDLDPYAPPADGVDSQLIPVKQRYHGSNDGLAATNPWSGKVFLFPPTGKALDAWIRRAVQEFEQERVSEVLLLIPEQPKADWNELLDDFPRVVLRPLKTTEDEEPAGMSAPHLLVALIPAERLDAFQRVTAVCGPCFVPVSFA